MKDKEREDMKAQRMEELVAGMTSFRKENYHKDELLSEMFALSMKIMHLQQISESGMLKSTWNR